VPRHADASRRLGTCSRRSPPWYTALWDASHLLWGGLGRIVGVLGWDVAQRFDPALDAAWLLSQQWDPVRVGVDAEQLRRIRIWALTLGLEPTALAILDQAPEERLAYQVRRAVTWLDPSSARSGIG
jgi:hypothetical protein